MSEARFSYRALLRESVRLFGWSGTLIRLTRGGYEFMRDSLPGRKRMRYGDLDYDFEHRVDTTWSNISSRTRFREIFAGRGYQATDPAIFREMMHEVGDDLREYTFVDLGSGKGRALLLAREFGFRHIVGLELLPELDAAAQRNVGRLPAEEQSRFELTCGDARRFVFPSGPIFIYLFDPFPAEILTEVMANLERALREQPRRVIIGYQNPISEHVVAASPPFRKVGGTMQWALFETRDSLQGPECEAL